MTIITSNTWPFDTDPRPAQIKALEWLSEQDAKYLILESPVGSGKSNLGIAYSHMLSEPRLPNQVRGNSYILTPQRILQSQYEESFGGMSKINIASFYGKSNYTCSPKNTNCDIGGLVRPKCPSCPFEIAKKIAKAASNTVLNYKLALILFGFGTSLKPRPLIIFDECHTLENHLIEFDALKITEFRCKRYKIEFKIQKTLSSALSWMRDYYVPEIRKALTVLQSECEPLRDKAGYELTRNDIRKLRELDSFTEHVDESSIMISRDPLYIDENFVLVHESIAFQFKRLYGSYTFNKIVRPMTDNFLFMSSTILNKKGFCSDLGIDPHETAFLSLDSDFPKENRPVYYIPQMKVNAKWNTPENASDRANLLKAIEMTLDLHKEDTGIIHTGNFQIADWIVKNLEKKISHHIYHHNPGSGDDRNDIIEAFTTDPKPSVLISPSSTEGLDLKEDLGRFAIFVKVPYLNLGDNWVKKRMEISTEWYQRQALINVIQGGGRVVRSKDDWGKVYILDGSWSYLYKCTSDMVPQWWKDAYSLV